MPTPRQLNTRYGLRTGTKSVVDGAGTVVDVGTLASLTTTDKTNIVSAVNEVKTDFVNIDTDDVVEGLANLYYTDTRSRAAISVTDAGGDGSLGYDTLTGVLTYTGPSAAEVRAHFSGGTGVTITDGVVAIGQAVSTSSDVTFNDAILTGVLYGPAQFVIDPAAFGDATGEVIILGDLTVQGATTTINSTTVEVADKNILLAKSATDSFQANGAGISVAGAGASILYTATTDSWNLNRTVKGVDGDNSSPTYSFATDPGLGLYRSGDDQASVATNGLERFRIGDTAATLVGSLDLVFDRGTYDGTVTVAALTANRTYTLPDVSGTLVTSGDTGTVTSAMIVNGTIVNEDINASAGIVDTKLATIATSNKVSLSALDIDGGTDIGAALTDSDLFIVDDGGAGTNRKAAATRITDYVFGKVSGDITVASTGTAAIVSGVIVDSDINASAGIAFSKLASLTSANILVGNASNIATSVAVTGDINISNTGVTAIAAGVIIDSDINASAGIVDTKLATISTAGKVSNSATTATSANTVNTIVARDGSGNFTAGTITAALTGNADTATKLSSTRTFTLSGNVTGTISSDLDTGFTISTSIASGVVTSDMIANGTIVDVDISASAGIVDTKLATISTAGKVSNSATTATSANTVNTIVARDGSGNFTAGTITAALTGNADTATKLSSSRTFAVTGDITGTVSSDLTTGASIATSIAAGVIVDADVNASAGIAFSKLAPLTSANILVGSSGNVATSVAVTGDVTIGNTGVTAISAGVIVDADVSASAEIAVSKLADGSARQLLETAADGVTVQWTDNIDVPGTLDVTGAAVFDSRVTINGTDITESARDIEESRLIRRNGTVSIGTPGTVPFGVGPVIPPGMSLVGIGPDAYNVIDIYSGSVC
jgi:hypothetical protein